MKENKCVLAYMWVPYTAVKFGVKKPHVMIANLNLNPKP